MVEHHRDSVSSGVSTKHVQLEGLPSDQAKDLRLHQLEKLKAVADFDHLHSFKIEEDDKHGHAEHPKSIFTAFASAVINFLLMFGLCSAYGMIMFEHDWNSRHRGMAVKMNLATAFFVGLALSIFSKIPVAIGGPDLNPVVFLGMFTTTIAEELAKQHGLLYPDTGERRLLEQYNFFDGEHIFRQLAGSYEDVEFCTGDHYSSNVAACTLYHRELAATTVFAVASSSALLGILYFFLGRFKLVGLVAYIPTNIMEAFLACVGYKVFKYALKFCKYEPRQFIPAACVGVPLYIVKSRHIGNPAIGIPLMLLVPLAIFYGVLFASGGNVESARKEGWFFAEIENAKFWDVWKACCITDQSTFAEAVNLKAWTKTLVDLPIMVIVCVLDCLLKLSSTESKLPVKADKEYEVQLFGISNILTTLTGSSVGYMQLKFNVINYGVMRTMNRQGGFLYALMCGICWFWTTDMFNYLPRFFLSTLLFFAGAGFIAENMWGSQQYLTSMEWLEICAILGVFILRESLLEAVIFGGLVTGCIFIVRYAHIPCIQGHPLMGGEIVLSTRRGLLMDCNIRYLANDRAMIMQLKGYIFFASAQMMAAFVEQRLNEEHASDFPTYRSLKWIIFDCELLDGFDSSASKCMAKLAKFALSMGVQFIWCGMSKTFRSKLQACGTIEAERDWFDTLDTAMHHVHYMLTQDIVQNVERWKDLHPLFNLAHDQAYTRYDSDPFSEILQNDAQYFGDPHSYCQRLSVKAYETVLWKPNTSPSSLFLIHSGQIGLFHHIPTCDSSGKFTWELPYAIYTSGWFLNPRAVFGFPTQAYAVALQDGEILCWSERDWGKLKRDRPRMSNAILTAALQQEVEDLDLAEQAMQSGSGFELFDSDAINRNKQRKIEKMRFIQFQMIHQEIHGIAIAQGLESLGLFEPVTAAEEHVFREMPKQIIEDINVVFQLFAVPSEEKPDVLIMPRRAFRKALTYAGIFFVAVLDPGKDELTQYEFLMLCQRGLLPSLSVSMISKLRALFKDDLKHGKTSMTQNHFVEFFRHIIASNIPADNIQMISIFWCGEERRVEEDAFFAIVSRFVQKYMPYWLVLKGGQELFGSWSGDGGRMITIDSLMKVADLEKSVAEEMIWCANFCSEQGDDSTSNSVIDFRVLAAIILRLAPKKPIALPPQREQLIQPQTTNRGMVVSLDEPEVDLISNWARSVVADFRDSDSKFDQLKFHSRLSARASSDVQMILNHEDSQRARLVEVEEAATVPISSWGKVWLIMDEPRSSTPAKVFSIIMGIISTASIVSLFLEPIISPEDEDVSDAMKILWIGLEAFFTVIFTIEYILRVSICNYVLQQTRIAFIFKPTQICDLLAILPFYCYIFFSLNLEEFRLFRLAHVMRSTVGKRGIVRQKRFKNSSSAPILVILVAIWFIDMKYGIQSGARN